MNTKHIQIADYDYALPDERIAKFPLKERDHSKLLVYRHGQICHRHFYDLPELLPEGALLVCNNTKVIQARLHFRKDTGALIEVFLMEPAQPTDYELMFQSRGHCSWLCMIGNLKKWKEGSLTRTIEIPRENLPASPSPTSHFTLHTSHSETSLLTLSASLRRDFAPVAGGTNYWVDFSWDDESVSFAELLDAVGELPIPPYLNRKTEESDKVTYQTVYSKIKGSVAAPTAGLHFTDSVLQAIDRRGITRDEVTLHVGAGTFKPVKSAEIEGHQMHTEYIVVHRHTLDHLISHQCRAIAVGTTSVRTLESLYYMGVKALTQHSNDMGDEEFFHVAQWEPYDLPHNADGLVLVNDHAVTPIEAITALRKHLDDEGLDALHSSTQIIIAPGYRYKIVGQLITNFHQPQSTLLLLVSAFLGEDHWHDVYDYALANDFRFLSYGDSSLLIP